MTIFDTMKEAITYVITWLKMIIEAFPEWFEITGYTVIGIGLLLIIILKKK